MGAGKQQHQGWTPEAMSTLSGKTYLITGATSGTGFQTARALLAKGAKVVMLNRNPAKSKETIATLKNEFGHDTDVEAIQLDLADLSNVKAAAQKILDTVASIDALICNAAIAQVPNHKLTIDGFESQLGTNHYGHFALCGMLFDRIEKSLGRIIVVASLGYNLGLKTIQFDDMNWRHKYSPNSAYSQSKLAQMMFAYELQDRVSAAEKKVEVYVCHPGSSSTSLIKTNGNKTTRFLFWLMTKTPIVQTAEKGAYPALMCATQDGLEQRALYGPTGMLEFVGPVGKGTLNAHAYDKATMQRLWEISEQETGVAWEL
ncbi:MAG: SDR family oxidoreductase [Alphaproteobacteria bacterium]|nr:SDR family oxidoreductase [Alphaproteobacteria bacterium]